jgi:3-hydroxybutyryl-CoA dehydrogenase
VSSAGECRTLGVLGAGTMGASIAQVALVADFDVVVYDPLPGALDTAVERIAKGMRRQIARGCWDGDEDMVLAARLRLSAELDALGGCEVVIEAVPEQLDLKRQVLTDVAAVCGPKTVLASNTSSISPTLIAAGTPNPERVVGMHFFNPVPIMGLVEVIAAEQTSADVLARARKVAEAFGKQVIQAPDVPGFLVNRCGRPFYGEALRILSERISDHVQIDRICRLGGGFRMGPFELMDLVGVDVNLAVARSFHTQSFGEPRWRPSPLQARMVASGRLGRKCGRGWYLYHEGAHRPEDPPPPTPSDAGGRTLAVIGDCRLAGHIRQLASRSGFTLHSDVSPRAVATIFADPDYEPLSTVDAVPCPIVSCARHSLAGRQLPTAVGFGLANFARGCDLVELTTGAGTSPEAVTTAYGVFAAFGARVEQVADGPGLVLGRLLAQVVNEAVFAYGEGLATAADIDAGTVLGLNYPCGSLTWGAALGWDDVIGTLDGIWQERREESYRPAPALIAAAAGSPMAISGVEQSIDATWSYLR